ncbi:MAG: hypothetical protein K1X74_08665 [Pirellulales bacterium]|nr:hypothetical protein [Pirellulales bacterium]
MATSLPDELLVDDQPLGGEEAGMLVEENLCPHCSAPGLGEQAEWCLKCGWFPKFNFCIEVDPQEAPVQASTNPWDPRRVPLWVWTLLAGLVVVTAVSIGARFLFPLGSWSRAYWAIGQWVIGSLAFGVVHLVAFLTAIAEDSDLKLLDIALRPFKVWKQTFVELPVTSRRVCIGVWSLCLAIMGPAVVGGIPYHLIWELGPEEEAAPNLIHAVVDLTDNANDEDMNMEEAMEKMTGKNADDENQDNSGDLEEPVDPYAPENLPKRRHKLDCLVVGYKPQGSSGFSSLVLAAVVKEKLQVVGTVSNQYIAPKVREAIFAELHALECAQPLVPTTIDAVWVKPKLACRVGHNGFGASNRISETVFQKRLSDVDLN